MCVIDYSPLGADWTAAMEPALWMDAFGPATALDDDPWISPFFGGPFVTRPLFRFPGFAFPGLAFPGFIRPRVFFPRFRRFF